MHTWFATSPNVKRKRPRRPHRRHFRGRERVAVKRAMTAARLYLNGTFKTLIEAATSCGSNIHYVRAAVTLIQAENTLLMTRVLAGHASLLKAAHDARGLAGLVKAYRVTTDDDHVAFARVIGPTTLFDNAVAPAI